MVYLFPTSRNQAYCSWGEWPGPTREWAEKKVHIPISSNVSGEGVLRLDDQYTLQWMERSSGSVWIRDGLGKSSDALLSVGEGGTVATTSNRVCYVHIVMVRL